MRFKPLILLIVSLFILFSCDSGLKFENPNDPNNQTADSKETGTLGGKCYPNKTCDEGLICDKESKICIELSVRNFRCDFMHQQRRT